MPCTEKLSFYDKRRNGPMTIALLCGPVRELEKFITVDTMLLTNISE